MMSRVDAQREAISAKEDVPGGQRVRGNLWQGEEFIAFDGPRVILKEVMSMRCQGEWSLMKFTLSSFIKRFRNRSTSSRSTAQEIRTTAYGGG